jgi:hypothetical protein
MNMVTQLFQKLDTVSISAIQTIYTSLVTALLPVFTVGVTLYVVYWGYEMIYGRASLTAGAFVWRMLRIWLIYLIASAGRRFQSLSSTCSRAPRMELQPRFAVELAERDAVRRSRPWAANYPWCSPTG